MRDFRVLIDQVFESTPLPTLGGLGRTPRFSAISCFMAFCRDSRRRTALKGIGNLRFKFTDFGQKPISLFGKRQEGTEGRRGKIQAHAEGWYSFGAGLTSQNRPGEGG